MFFQSNFLGTEGWSVKNVPLPGSPVKIGFAHKIGGDDRDVHRHQPGEHEIFVVLKGTAKITVDGQVFDIKSGDLVVMSTEEHGLSQKSLDFEVVLMMIMPT